MKLGKYLLKLIKGFFSTILVCLVACFLVAAWIGVYKLYPMYLEYKKEAEVLVADSTPDDFRLDESSYIYDAGGNQLAKLSLDVDSAYLEYDEIPQYAIDAFIAIEDRSFWENPGIDMKGILRVGINFLRTEGEEMHGASTITQQLVRNQFLTREVSIIRKIKEIMISLELTKKYTKEQIMEFYVNDISFANTYCGLEAAARGYFNKSADELSLSQIAYICAIPNRPTYYNPYKNPDNALKRRDKILDDMMECGFISREEYEEAVAEEIVVTRPPTEFKNYQTTYAIDCAVRYLMEQDGFEFQYGFRTDEAYREYTAKYNESYDAARYKLYTGGYKIYTSLEPGLQTVLQQAVDEGLSFSDEVAESGIYALQGAATAIDNETGKVVAIVGGRDQEVTTYTLNRAFQSFRQPGSAIKPILVYAPALEKGYTSNSVVYDIDVSKAKESGVDVLTLTGPAMSLRNGVERSRNGVAWSVYVDITPEYGMSFLTKMRFDNIVPGDYYPATALGGFTYGATTEEMAGAYATLVNGGLYRNPTCLVSMLDKNGSDIYREAEETRVYSEDKSMVMVDILKGVVSHGTAAGMGWRSEIEAAGKTGTTNDGKDGWFCGMTPYYTISVWVGYDQPRSSSALWGSTYPSRIWKQAMMQFINGKEPGRFPPAPAGTGTREIHVPVVLPPPVQEVPVETAPPETQAPVIEGIHGGPGVSGPLQSTKAPEIEIGPGVS